MREAVAPAHPAFELVQGGKPQTVGVDDHEGVRPRQVDAVFDDGGGDEHLGFAAVKFHHGVFERGFVHLPVRHREGEFGQQVFEPVRKGKDAFHAVIEHERLPAAVDLP